MFGMIPFDRRDDNLFDVFDNFEKKFFGNTNASLPAFRTDIRDQGDKFLLEAELPGFQKDEIHVDVKDGYLTVSAQKGLDKDEQDKKGRVLRQERYAGACSRSFYVGHVKPEDVKAKYEDGVLSVIVPKEDVKKLASSTAIVIE